MPIVVHIVVQGAERAAAQAEIVAAAAQAFG
jgi:hypothetical protein